MKLPKIILLRQRSWIGKEGIGDGLVYYKQGSVLPC